MYFIKLHSHGSTIRVNTLHIIRYEELIYDPVEKTHSVIVIAEADNYKLEVEETAEQIDQLIAAMKQGVENPEWTEEQGGLTADDLRDLDVHKTSKGIKVEYTCGCIAEGQSLSPLCKTHRRPVKKKL